MRTSGEHAPVGGREGLRLEVLSSADLDAIHAETLKVLEQTGVFVDTDRRVYEGWQAEGTTDMYESARRRACELAGNHQREPLDEDVKRQMRAIVERADSGLGRGETYMRR